MLFRSSQKGALQLKAIATKPVFVAQTKTLGDIFGIMKKSREKIVIVMDEYGGFSGIITMQDIIEEIVGELFDKNVQTEERIYRQKDGSFIISGDTPFVAVLDFLSRTIEPLPPAHTLAGYCAWRLDRIPEKGDTINTELGILVILETRHNRAVRIQLKPSEI